MTPPMARHCRWWDVPDIPLCRLRDPPEAEADPLVDCPDCLRLMLPIEDPERLCGLSAATAMW